LSETWPPPAQPGEWRELRVDPDTVVQVRPVVLWGRQVLIDQASRVWCPSCRAFVDAADLGRIDNTHPVGLPFRATGRLVPAEEEDTAGDEQRLAGGHVVLDRPW